MMRRVSTLDVARRAGVSKTTVSYVLNGRTDVAISGETRQRVLDAARDLDYTPNRAARALATGRTQLIALWTPCLYPPYYAKVIHHIQVQLKQSHYEMMVADTSTYIEWEAHLDRLSQWPVDGIIALDSPAYVSRFLEISGNRHVPLVTMGVYKDDHAVGVLLDIYPGAWDAMRHLLASGRRRVAYMVDRDRLPGEARHGAYSAAMREVNLPEEYIIITERTPESAYQGVTEHVTACGCPDAIFCHNDDMAVGVNRALRDLGFRVPEDVAITGYDGIADTEFTDPRITTVVTPAEEMCATAWNLLQQRIAAPSDQVQHIYFRPRLVVRESSRRRDGQEVI
jgi:LacI family transcriptional regulator